MNGPFYRFFGNGGSPQKGYFARSESFHEGWSGMDDRGFRLALAEEIKRDLRLVRHTPEISTPIRFPPHLRANLPRYPRVFLSDAARASFDLLL